MSPPSARGAAARTTFESRPLPKEVLAPVAAPSLARRSAPRAATIARDVLDRATALALVTALSPLFLALVAVVRLSSPGSAFFRQRRAGRDGQPFEMLKFRSMHDGSHHLEDSLAGSGPFFKVREDSRVTAIGRVLRRTSLDELPQLLNVVRGEMSLVGPRPLMLREHRELPEHVRAWRFAVRPGITGLWQVSGRSNTTDASRLRLDRVYVENAALALDAAILLRTPAAVLRAEGAV